MLTPTIPGPDPDTRIPDFVLPPLACDAHCHIFGPSAQYPYAPDRPYTPPDAGLDDFRALHNKLGIGRAVIVNASVHGTDNRVALRCDCGLRRSLSRGRQSRWRYHRARLARPARERLSRLPLQFRAPSRRRARQGRVRPGDRDGRAARLARRPALRCDRHPRLCGHADKTASALHHRSHGTGEGSRRARPVAIPDVDRSRCSATRNAGSRSAAASEYPRLGRRSRTPCRLRARSSRPRPIA